jgi:hypothetical protein
VLITQIRDEVLAAEQSGSGIVQVGTSDDITSILTTLVMSIDQMKETIHEEKTALSQAAGFMNPDAVSAVDAVTVPAITGPMSGTAQAYQASATNRAIQLLQIDDLIQAAQETKDSRYWQWLDLTGDDQGSIGFGSVSYVQVGSSMVRQLYDKKASTESTLLQTVDTVFSQSGQMAQQYQLAGQESTTAQARVNRLLMDFHTGIAFTMADLVSALHDKAQGDIDQINAQYAYLTIQAQMDFLTYSGPYAVLLGEQWSQEQSQNSSSSGAK